MRWNSFAGHRWKLRDFAPCLGSLLGVYPRLMFLRAASATGSAAPHFVLRLLGGFPEKLSQGA